MANSRGPYPADLGFERWHDDSGIYRREFSKAMCAVVNFLPSGTGSGSDNNCGWGYVVLVAGMVANGCYDNDWTAEDAMRAAIAKAESGVSW